MKMKSLLRYISQAFTIIEIAMVVTIAAVVIYAISNSLGITQKRGKAVRTDYDTESGKFAGVMATGDNSIAFPADISISTVKKSCKEILDAGLSTGSKEYTIDPDGSGTNAGSFKVYCDMDTSHGGGGWTLVVAQFESSKVTDWNIGINEATFTPPTASQLDNGGGTGFALNTAQLPTGTTQTAFGKGSDATFVGYSNYVYTTGNITGDAGCPGSGITVVNIKDSLNYQIHRSTDGLYNGHDPESGPYCNVTSSYRNTLTYDKMGGSFFSWAFSPLVGGGASGYGLQGYREFISDSFAWTVWMR